MRSTPTKEQTQNSRQRGASIVEYTLLLGIVATIGISAMRTIGAGLADSSDPCHPGLFVKAAIILGEPNANQLRCDQPNAG